MTRDYCERISCRANLRPLSDADIENETWMCVRGHPNKITPEHIGAILAQLVARIEDLESEVRTLKS
jgi:hypothetical protein